MASPGLPPSVEVLPTVLSVPSVPVLPPFPPLLALLTSLVVLAPPDEALLVTVCTPALVDATLLVETLEAVLVVLVVCVLPLLDATLPVEPLAVVLVLLPVTLGPSPTVPFSPADSEAQASVRESKSVGSFVIG